MFGKSAIRSERPAGFVRKLSVAVAASASLGAILLACGPAHAMPVSLQACQKKHEACGVRCQQKYSGVSDPVSWATKVSACLTRTCDKQYKSCKDNATGPGGGGGGKLETGGIHNPRPEQASSPYITGNKAESNPQPPMTNNSSPLGTGILDGGNGMGGNGPSATGSPAGGGMPKAPPAAPPVILR